MAVVIIRFRHTNPFQTCDIRVQNWLCEGRYMTDVNDQKLETLWLIVKSLYRASVVGFLILIAFLPFLFMTDFTYAYHNSIIPMDRPTYNATMFYLYAEMKIFIIVFLFLPAVGLHWTLAKQRRTSRANNVSS